MRRTQPARIWIIVLGTDANLIKKLHHVVALGMHYWHMLLLAPLRCSLSLVLVGFEPNYAVPLVKGMY